MKVGVTVTCAICGWIKKPYGRSGPLGAFYCDEGCQGYLKPPYVGSLWPGESEDDFGYPVSADGTKDVPREQPFGDCAGLGADDVEPR
jgi:hypothetical protein